MTGEKKQARLSAETQGKKSSRKSTSSEVDNHKLAHDSAQRGRRMAPSSKFPCEVCGQLYSRLDNLRVHQRMHSGEMPFKCKFCGQPFRWVGALRSHEGSHTRNSNFAGNTRDHHRSVSGTNLPKSNPKSKSSSSSRSTSKYGGERKKESSRPSGGRNERSHPLPSMITLSDVDPGIKDFDLPPWHDILDDWNEP